MNASRPIPCLVAGLLLALPAAGVHAHDGEIHDDAPVSLPPPVLSGAPRASAATESFEAVAVLAAGEMQLYLDRYDSNAPVTGAQVGVAGTGVNGSAQEISPGVYTLPVPALPPGQYGLTLSVETADDADLLLLTLEVPAEADAAVSASGGFARNAGLAALALVLFAGGVIGGIAAWRRWRGGARA